MAVTTNLYPPIVDTWMPAFLIDSEDPEKNKCKIYFSLSLFNIPDEIDENRVQVTIRNQSTNLSALNLDKYPSEIMLTHLNYDENRLTDDKYYVTILPSDMRDENFEVDQYYKVQIRFTEAGLVDPPSVTPPQAIDDWLNENLLHFSEWSTVCLIRGISVPTLDLKDLNGGLISVKSLVANLDILGTLRFADENETETLKSYQICLYDENRTKLLVDSGIIYTSDFSNPNEINYPLNYCFEINNEYWIDITFTTQNLYTEEQHIIIQVDPSQAADLKMVIRGWGDEENGRVILKISRTRGYEPYTGQLIIRRTDSNSNFTIWEDLYTKGYNGAQYISILWADYTLESGVWYKYGIQGVDTNGYRTPMIQFEEPIMLLLDHMFLTGGDKQLKLKFNPQISSYKINVSEAKSDTIGSKYPIIRRNGDMYYASFPISGFIAAAMDEDGTFTTKSEIYGDNASYYEDYNNKNEVDSHQDFIYEKLFRDKVKAFLNNGDVKLFRSPSEGNLLVRLMDVSFTPNQTLGRRLWTFSATAYEIDEYSIDNCAKYDIFTRVVPEIGTMSGNPDLRPIKRIVFINNYEEFPDEGKDGVLYIFEEQFYLWDEENRKFSVVSVPEWYDENHQEINRSGIFASSNLLYTDGVEIYRWDGISTFEEISEPIENQRYYPEHDFEEG